jgi:hypothetical protein
MPTCLAPSSVQQKFHFFLLRKYFPKRNYPRIEVIEGFEGDRTRYDCFARVRNSSFSVFTFHNFLCSSCGSHRYSESQYAEALTLFIARQVHRSMVCCSRTRGATQSVCSVPN